MSRYIAQLMPLVFALVGSVAHAHGGVSVEKDVCIMKLGEYRSHFTGYIPESRATQEFCEDIPDDGNVVMVMDFISDELRAMDVDFRIVRDTMHLGRSAQYKDLGGQAAIERDTVFYMEPRKYPRGTLSASHRFDGKGMFIGIVTARTNDGQVRISVFPFEVGRRNYWGYVAALVLAIMVSVGLYRYASREKSA